MQKTMGVAPISMRATTIGTFCGTLGDIANSFSTQERSHASKLAPDLGQAITLVTLSQYIYSHWHNDSTNAADRSRSQPSS
jgi:hypothetical protein